jgi:predicted transposase YbfD/YdcC
VFARPVHRDAVAILSGEADHPILQTTEKRPVLNIDALNYDDQNGLRNRLTGLPDTRARRGVRHPQEAVLVLAVMAVMAGMKSFEAIGEWVSDIGRDGPGQDLLARAGLKLNKRLGRYVAPSADTIGRAFERINVAMFDRLVGEWLYDQVRDGRVTEEAIAIALDGKVMRGAYTPDGEQVHLFAAMVHNTGEVIGQEQVAHDSNEITAFQPLLEPMDISGVTVTADALHAQRSHAKFLVNEKKADYLFQVKGNQPNLFARVQAIPVTDYGPEHITTDRGHGRSELRSVRVADAPDVIDFPHASQIVSVYRERSDLNELPVSTETSYYITSASKQRASVEQLGTRIRGHWGIENRVHYVRDWTYDEDRHQLRRPNSSRVIAALRNIAISVLRRAGATNMAKATRWVSRDPQRAAALIGI